MSLASIPTATVPQRAAVPTGYIVPDLTAKRSLVLEKWQAERTAARVHATAQDRLRQQAANAARSYAGAEVSRLTGDWQALNTSADSELLTSLRVLRARSRQLVRDNPYAKQAVRLIVNNVIGTGIGLQSRVVNARNTLLKPINDSIEAAYLEWSKAETCHTGGKLCWADIERYALAQLVTSGEFIARIVRQPFGGGKVPLAIEVIESDRLLDQWQTAKAPNGNIIRMGVECDEWGRPVAYWFAPKHPGDYQFATFEPSRFVRIPAEDIIHLYIVERWPQTRGEPWFHSVLRSLHDVGGYEEAEIVKARASANVVGFIRSPERLTEDDIVNGRRVIDTEPGQWQTLLPGEDVAGFNTATPNAAVEPFLRYMLRKMGVGIGVSYESLSRDYSQSNYSSSRMALLDDRDCYRALQGFFIRGVRDRVHREFVDAANLVGAIKTGPDYYTATAKYLAARFKPRGWSWIDPAKEVAAYKMAVRCGFMSSGDVIAQTNNGLDTEDVLTAIAEERAMADDLGLVFDTDTRNVNDKGQAQPVPVDPANDQGQGAPTNADPDAGSDPDKPGENDGDQAQDTPNASE